MKRKKSSLFPLKRKRENNGDNNNEIDTYKRKKIYGYNKIQQQQKCDALSNNVINSHAKNRYISYTNININGRPRLRARQKRIVST